MFNNISFILHKPQLSENIGACARAMKNFNFSKLIVINPKPSFPNDKIVATSVGANDIIKNSKVYLNLVKETLSKERLTAMKSFGIKMVTFKGANTKEFIKPTFENLTGEVEQEADHFAKKLIDIENSYSEAQMLFNDILSKSDHKHL